MGQSCFGVLYGCKTEHDWYEKEDGELLPRYLKETGRTPRGTRPEWTFNEEFCLIGFWIAVGGSGVEGVPYLSSFALTRPFELYGDAIDKAKERWALFAAWCAEQGHILGEPELFLAETETG